MFSLSLFTAPTLALLTRRDQHDMKSWTISVTEGHWGIITTIWPSCESTTRWPVGGDSDGGCGGGGGGGSGGGDVGGGDVGGGDGGGVDVGGGGGGDDGGGDVSGW